ncbi:MAG: hypothetical protein HYX94_03785 [Chloroflexi bacterium]|nr:hypothetical protein [Chloroflexota bacterium]
MKLFVEPVDVWLFRDGRPFDLGGDHQARSVFPPLPTVVQGAMRSHHLAVRGASLADYLAGRDRIDREIGAPGSDAPNHLRFRGPIVAKATGHRGGKRIIERFFPLPADALVEESSIRAMQPSRRTVGATNLPDGVGLIGSEGAAAAARGGGEGRKWLREADLRTYLQEGGVSKECTVGESCLFVYESRFGIGRDDRTRGTREGLLYEARKVRPCDDVGLYVEVDGLTGWPQRGVMAFGGEGHGARYEMVDLPTLQPEPCMGDMGFKVVFLTPTFFAKGWQPGDWSALLGSPVVFRGAAVGKPVVLGGFDMAKKRHKPARRYVPAGSVYFFEGTPPQGLQSISEFGGNIGFGQFLIGRW